VGAINAAYKIRKNSDVSLSKQQMVDCDARNMGCNGGIIDYGKCLSIILFFLFYFLMIIINATAMEYVIKGGCGFATSRNKANKKSLRICR
jgi:hypothetical protein